MTIIERLREVGAAEQEAQKAAAAIAAALPVGRSVVVDDEILQAARDGDLVALQFLLAEEEKPSPEELEALTQLEREVDRRTLSAAKVDAELGLS